MRWPHLLSPRAYRAALYVPEFALPAIRVIGWLLGLWLWLAMLTWAGCFPAAHDKAELKNKPEGRWGGRAMVEAP
jgi:hypothetical protein